MKQVWINRILKGTKLTDREFSCPYRLNPGIQKRGREEWKVMESTVMETAVSQGIWAVLAVFLLIYIVKSNEKRDAKQEEREKNYQTVIESLTEKFQILTQVQSDLKEI